MKLMIQGRLLPNDKTINIVLAKEKDLLELQYQTNIEKIY
jgi:hypothetical protein